MCFSPNPQNPRLCELFVSKQEEEGEEGEEEGEEEEEEEEAEDWVNIASEI